MISMVVAEFNITIGVRLAPLDTAQALFISYHGAGAPEVGARCLVLIWLIDVGDVVVGMIVCVPQVVDMFLIWVVVDVGIS